MLYIGLRSARFSRDGFIYSGLSSPTPVDNLEKAPPVPQTWTQASLVEAIPQWKLKCPSLRSSICAFENTMVKGWRDGLDSKVLAEQAGGCDFTSQQAHRKSSVVVRSCKPRTGNAGTGSSLRLLATWVPVKDCVLEYEVNGSWVMTPKVNPCLLPISPSISTHAYKHLPLPHKNIHPTHTKENAMVLKTRYILILK